MVRLLSVGETLDLRNRILRNNAGEEFAHFDEDSLPGVFHVGYQTENQVVCTATFIPVCRAEFEGKGFQLRGMATDANFSGTGCGTAVIKFAISFLHERNVDYIWCNARKTAVEFYEKLGFTVTSNEFMIENIGIHLQMHLNLHTT